MSKLDKDQVIADYTAAYQQRHGTTPTIEASSGWYSVNGGKNMRLAQLAEEAKALAASDPKGTSNTTSKPTAKKAAATKSTSKKATNKPAATVAAPVKVVSSNKGGLSAKELWRKRLEEHPTLSRLPRGYDA